MCMLGIKIAIAEMKNCSAPGDDEVTVDMMKAAGPIGMQCVYILYKCIVIWKVWQMNDTDDWKKAVIIPVYKKGDKKLL